MNYVKVEKRIEVYDEQAELWYVNESVTRVDVFENGNLVIEDETSIVFVSSRTISVLANILDYMVIDSFVFVVDRKNNSVCGYIYNDEFEEESRLMLVDGLFWIQYTSLLGMVFPFSSFEVTGYRDSKLYGYKGRKKMVYNIKTRSYAPVKKIKTNLVDALQSRVIEED